MSKWKAGGVMFPHGPFMIGAGVCKTPGSAKRWLQVAPVSTGSYTDLARSGNEGKVVWPETFEEMIEIGYGLNSYGMPNMGFARVAEELAEIKSDQPIIANIAGFSVDEYVRGVEVFSSFPNVAALELNFGCPNTQGEHQDIMSFNLSAIRGIIEGIIAKGLVRKPLWLKFSPYSNPAELKRMADLINIYTDDLTLAVVTCNTFGNAYAGEGKIDTNFGMAGLSGSALKAIALGQVKQFRQHLAPKIDVIGVGGAMSGDDVVDFLDAGAKVVQLTSLPHWVGDPRRFTDHFANPETASRYLTLIS